MPTPPPADSSKDSSAVANSEMETYPASCHCGAVSFTVKLPNLDTIKVMNCNCSICEKNGYLLVYPKREDVEFHGDSLNQVSKYQFNTKKKDHWFCSRCGTSLLIDFNGIYPTWDVLAVNVRTFKGLDIDSLKLKTGNGKAL